MPNALDWFTAVAPTSLAVLGAIEKGKGNKDRRTRVQFGVRTMQIRAKLKANDLAGADLICLETLEALGDDVAQEIVDGYKEIAVKKPKSKVKFDAAL